MRRPRTNIQTTVTDLSFILMVGLAAVLVMVVAMVNPKSKDVSSPPAGDVVVEAYWDDSIDADVDLWVRAPNDDQPVGYSSRAGRQSNYLRDDVGHHNDPSGRNYEFAFCRGRTAGRYVVNVHFYDSRGHHDPLQVRVVVTLMKGGRPGEAKGAVPVASRAVRLRGNGDEQTAISFALDAAGNVVPESLSGAYIPLRGGWQEE